MTCGNSTYGNFPGTGTINPINLTQYRKLCIEYTYTDTKGYSHVNRWTVCNQKYNLSEATHSGGVEGQTWMFPLGINRTHKVDISSYKGLWYINGVIHHQNPTTKVYVYNIWLER